MDFALKNRPLFIFLLILLVTLLPYCIYHCIDGYCSLCLAVFISILISSAAAVSIVVISKRYFELTKRLKIKLDDERSLAEALRQSEERYRAIFESSDYGILVVEKSTGAIAEFNDRLAKMLDYTHEELSRLTPGNIESGRHANIRSILGHGDKTPFTTKASIRFRTSLRSKSGLEIPAETSMVKASIADKDYLIFMFKDVSSELLMEKNLHEHLRFSSKLLEVVPVPIFYRNAEGRYLGCNSAFENLIGLKRDAIVGKSLFDIFPKETAEAYALKDKELFNNPRAIQSYATIFKNNKGEIRDITITKATYDDKKGKPIGIIGAVIDITELRRKTDEIRQNYERWQRTFDEFDDLIFIADSGGRIVLSNQEAKKHFPQLHAGDFGCGKLIGTFDANLVRCPCGDVFRDGKKRILDIFNKALNMYFECAFYPVRNAEGRVERVIHSMRNIDRRRKAELELQKSRKLLVAQNKSLVKLTDADSILGKPLDKFLEDAIVEASRVLKTTIVGVWFFDSRRTTLTCACQFDSRSGVFSAGEKITRRDFPSYFDSILNDRIISADDIHHDPGTVELLTSYLIPKGISSMMDALVCLGRDPIAVICCEHVGEPRSWTVEETNFLISITNIVSLRFHTSKAENTEKEFEKLAYPRQPQNTTS